MMSPQLSSTATRLAKAAPSPLRPTVWREGILGAAISRSMRHVCGPGGAHEGGDLRTGFHHRRNDAVELLLG